MFRGWRGDREETVVLCEEYAGLDVWRRGQSPFGRRVNGLRPQICGVCRFAAGSVVLRQQGQWFEASDLRGLWFCCRFCRLVSARELV